jgi:23S rRNA pseudouridine1911/1915/1917 synthase
MRDVPNFMQLELLHCDEQIAIVNKPAGIAVIPGRGETDSILEMLGRQLGIPSSGQADPRVRVVHRLDKDTTGVLLFALNVESQRFLSHQFQNNTIQKEYLALVHGRVEQDAGTIEKPIAPHPTDRLRMIVTKHGRAAHTDWRVEQRFRSYTLVRCFPKTGKTHQIRVHLQHIGHPLAIDPLYSDPRKSGIFLSEFKRGYRPSSDEERPLIARLTLHAHRLRFVHPTGMQMAIEAELPKDFRTVIKQLQKFGN